MKKLALLLSVLMSGSLSMAAPKDKAKAAKEKTSQAKEQVLKEGRYAAKVKALTCMGCGEYVQKALGATPGIGYSSVDQSASTVQFTVKKGAQVKLSEAQKNLNAWAGKMGMGADYTLSDLKPL